MRITNTQAGPRGVNTTAGVVLLGPGEARDLDLPDAELAVARRTGWFAFGEGAGSAASHAVPELHAVHRGRGSYSIMRGDEEVIDGLTKADADQFNALPAEDKAAFVAAKD